ncbi:MAG: ABC transporter substrate-binding protein [Burkholderiales bacterium]|nr:ABC transporter substrate-binding protein [Burkholderiales bacterium]MCE7877841.1 heme-binding protein [Betaproteobacteria bacterium PRO3]
MSIVTLFRGLAAALALALATGASAADPAKVYRIAFGVAETSFDPARVSDLYSNTVNEAIFERLLTYDYLARPSKLVPLVAETMPAVTDGGKTYTFKLRKGIFFTPDPAFKGVKRELVAADFAYTIKRHADPKNRSPWVFMVEGRIVGLDGLIEQAKKTGKFDYDAKIPGLETPDPYTLVIRLVAPDYLFNYTVAHVPFGAQAREVVEHYGQEQVGAHPVGTGPYFLKEWKRAARIVLEANPDYRGFVWDFAPSDDPWDQQVVRDMRGKKMPQIGRVEISIIEEDQSRWLAFGGKELDVLALPGTFRPQAIGANGELLPRWSGEGVKLYKAIDPDISYTFFNFRDPVVGGFEPAKLALRRAIIMAYDVREEIEVVRKGQAVRAQMPIPFGVVGHDPSYRTVNPYDPDLANKLLDRFGYRKGPDGWRTQPDGKPLVIRQATGTTQIDRTFNELWKKAADSIHVRMVFDAGKFADNLKQAKACQLMMWSAAWTADYPDGENFMQLLYGPNTGQSNNGCYESKSFDALYVKMRALPIDAPERNRLFLEMTRQMDVDGAWGMHVSRERNQMIRPWVLGYKKHPILHGEWLYMDLAPRS